MNKVCDKCRNEVDILYTEFILQYTELCGKCKHQLAKLTQSWLDHKPND